MVEGGGGVRKKKNGSAGYFWLGQKQANCLGKGVEKERTEKGE